MQIATYYAGTISEAAYFTGKWSTIFLGSITDMYGIKLSALPSPLIGGTVTNKYGLHITAPTGSVTGSAWSIYSLGGNSAHVGNLRIGDTTVPTNKLEVNGASIFGDGGTTDYTSISATGNITLNGTAGIALPHLMQSDSGDQQIASAVEEQIIDFDTDGHHHEITRTDSNTFTITKEGSYLLTFSAMAICSTAAPGSKLAIWMKKNGTNVPSSSTYYTFKGQNANTVITVTFVYHFEVDDYFEFWMYGDDTNIRLDAIAAVADSDGVTPAIPACPSIIMTCNYTGID